MVLVAVLVSAVAIGGSTAVLLFLAPWVMGYADETVLAWSSWIGGVLAVVIEGMTLPQFRHGGRPQPHG